MCTTTVPTAPPSDESLIGNGSVPLHLVVTAPTPALRVIPESGRPSCETIVRDSSELSFADMPVLPVSHPMTVSRRADTAVVATVAEAVANASSTIIASDFPRQDPFVRVFAIRKVFQRFAFGGRTFNCTDSTFR